MVNEPVVFRNIGTFAVAINVAPSTQRITVSAFTGICAARRYVPAASFTISIVADPAAVVNASSIEHGLACEQSPVPAGDAYAIRAVSAHTPSGKHTSTAADPQ